MQRPDVVVGTGEGRCAPPGALTCHISLQLSVTWQRNGPLGHACQPARLQGRTVHGNEGATGCLAGCENLVQSSRVCWQHV